MEVVRGQLEAGILESREELERAWNRTENAETEMENLRETNNHLSQK